MMNAGNLYPTKPSVSPVIRRVDPQAQQRLMQPLSAHLRLFRSAGYIPAMTTQQLLNV
jgi:hypothetical protein